MSDIRVSYADVPEEDWKRVFGKKKVQYFCEECQREIIHEDQKRGCPNGCNAGFKTETDEV